MKSFFPRLLALVLLIALGATLALWLRPAKTPPASQATASTGATHTPPPATASAPPATPATSVPATPTARTESLSPATPPTAGTARSIENRYAHAPIIDERTTAPDATGRFTKNRLVRTTEKYPHIRIEEQWQRDPATGHDTLLTRAAMVGDHLIVRAADGLTRDALETALAPTGGRIRRAIPGSSLYLIQTPGLTLEAYDILLASLRQSGLPLEYSEPDYVVYATFTPNDPSFGQLWGLHNTGQTGGSGDADIDATEAWDISRGSNTVLVAVIDTGIDHTHPDLAANMWTNPGEIPGNNIDDDGNGYIDDTRGWDFVNNDNNPADDQGHGTHCAGTIGAVGNNGIGVAGVAHTVRLVGAKFLSASGSGTTSDAIEAVLYTTGLGVTLTSNSWGGGGYSQALKDAIDAARTAGILFIAAAGNDYDNSDVRPSYPAGYDSPNIISVAASNHLDQLASFSNYGFVTVDLAAPGVSIYSTYPGGGYSSLSGTSMACPHVAGAAALLKSVNSARDWTSIKEALLANADRLPSLTGRVATGARLNIGRTLVVSAGPYIGVTSIQTLDGGTSGSSGNADGISNPGETLSLPISLLNIGSENATGLSTTLSITTGASHVQILAGTQAWPDLAPGNSSQSAADAFLLRIHAGVSTPQALVLRFTTTDDQNHTWSSDTALTVYTRSTISGRVTALTGGAPIAGATITLASSSPALTTTTDASGNYILPVLDGTHTVRATAPGHNASAPIVVTTPGDATAQNFILGRARLQVTPSSLTSTQYEDTTTQHSLTVSNTGDQTLQVSLSALSLGAASATLRADPARLLTLPASANGPSAPHTNDTDFSPSAFAPAASAGTLALPPAPLPFSDGFEDGSLAKWDTGVYPGLRETTTDNAGVGTTSLHLKNTGADSHRNGLTRTFPAGSKPRHISFWVRTASTTAHSGYFVLRDSYYFEDVIWFFAEGNGRFYVNNNVGGDSSYAYQANIWYRVEFRNMDWDTGRFDYHVNGSLVKASIPFRSYYRAQADSVNLYNFSAGSESWFDDIRILDDSARWLSYTPETFALAPGQNATVNVTLNSADLTPAAYQASLELNSNDPANPTTTVPVTLNVQLSPNTPPVAAPQSLTLDEDTSTAVALTGSDAENHNLSAYITTLATRGTLYQTPDGTTLGATLGAPPVRITHPQHKLIYVPNPDASGGDSFQFVMRDKRSESAPATVAINVTAINDTPLARNDTASSLPGQGPLTINVLANDSDADADTLTITAYTQGARGTVTTGSIALIYTPAAGFTEGVDTFTYTIHDGHGATATARVSIYLGYLAVGDWPTYAGSNARNAFYPASLDSKPFVQTWRIRLGATLTQPIVAEGRVFVGEGASSDSAVSTTALELSTGFPVWKKSILTSSYNSGPSYHLGSLYFRYADNAGASGKLSALDAASGATQWTSVISSGYYSSSRGVAVTDNSVVANSSASSLRVFNRDTGAPGYFATGDTYIASPPTIVEGAIYYVNNHEVVRRNLSTGTVEWRYPFGTSSYYQSVAVYRDGRIYFIAGSTLYAINVSPSGASTAWSVAGGLSGPPTVTATAIYAVSHESYPYIIKKYNPATGALLAAIPAGNNAINPPLIVTNDTLIATSNSQTQIIDLATSTIRQTLDGGGQISLSNGALLIATPYTNELICYRVDSGTNAVPVAHAQLLTGTEDQSLPISLPASDADGDSLHYIVTTLPSYGTLHQTTDGTTPGDPIANFPALVTHPAGKLVFRPAPDGFGTPYTSFKFKVNDGVFPSAEATVTLNIANINDAPVANDDTVPLLPGRPLASYWPTANDTDPDGETIRLIAFTQPARGTLTQETDGSLTYRPEPGFISGTDTFGYTIADSSNQTDTASVAIHINATAGLEWPTLGGAPDHAGRLPLSLGTTPFTLRWEYASEQSLHPAAIASGRIHIAESSSNGEYVYARSLDTTTGSQIWERALSPGTLNPPSHHAGTVYIQRNNSSTTAEFMALDETTGATRWTTPINSLSEASLAPAVSDLGAYIHGGAYGGLYGFNQTTGTQKFLVSRPHYNRWTPTLYEGGVYSYVAGAFASHDPETGAILWSLDVGWVWSGYSMNRTIACDNNRAYVTTNQQLICIDLTARSVVWRIQDTSTFTGTPAVMAGVVYVLSGTSVKTYAATSGVPLAEYNAANIDTYPGVLTGAPIVTGDLVIASNDYKTYIFNRATRAAVQSFSFGATPALVDGNLYLTSTDRKIRAYTRIPAGNRAPSANPVSARLLEEAILTLQLEATDLDGDPLKFAIRSLPANGTLYQTPDGITRGNPISRAPALVENPDGYVIYQAPLDITGPNLGSFTFTAHDLYASSVSATARIDLININDAPVAIPDTIALRPGESLLRFRPQDNDRDADGDALTLVSFTQPAQGTVAGAAGNSLSWTPPAGFSSGTATFDYTISDPSGIQSTSTITLLIGTGRGREWPTFGGAPDHAAYQPVSLGSTSLTHGWSRALGRTVDPIAVVGGHIYASVPNSHNTSELVALDRLNGADRWRLQFTGGYRTNSPSVHAGKIYMQYANSGASRLYALSANDGSTAWSAPFGAQWEQYFSPAVSDLGVFINGGTYGGIYGFNSTTGAQLFFKTLEQRDRWAPAIHDNRVFSFVDTTFREHDLSTGEPLWSLSFGGSNMSERALACDSGRAFLVNRTFSAGTEYHELIAIDLATRQVAWRVRGNFAGTPAVAHQLVYVLSAFNAVRAYDQASGRLHATYTLPVGETGIHWQPIVTNDTLIVAGNAKTYLFDLTSRQIRQTLPHGGKPALAGHTLYLVDNTQSIHAYTAPDPFNRAPTATSSVTTTAEDTPVTISLQGTDPENAPLTVSVTRLPASGTLHHTTDGVTPGAAITAVPALIAGPAPRVRYIPAPDANGNNLGNFGFTVHDGEVRSVEATATLHITPVNDSPLAIPDTFALRPGTSLAGIRPELNDRDVDGDILQVHSFTSPALGTLVKVSDGSLTYTPPGGFTGTVSFNYTAVDAAGALASSTVTLQVDTVTGREWTTVGARPTHTGYQPVLVGPKPLSPRWRAATYTDQHYPALVSGGLVVARGSEAGAPTLAALNIATGERQWNSPMGSAGTPPSAITLDNGVLYFAANSSTTATLRSLAWPTGTELWNAPINSTLDFGHGPSLTTHALYFGSAGNGIFTAASRTNGATLFSRNFTQYGSRGFVGAHQNAVYTLASGLFEQIDPVTGTAIWSLNLGSNSYGTYDSRAIVFDQGHAYLINDSYNSEPYGETDLVAINLTTRTLTWRVRGRFVGATPALAHGALYISTGRVIEARDQATGRLFGTYSLPDPASSQSSRQPVVTNDLLIVAEGSSFTHLFDLRSRQLRQTIPCGGHLSFADDTLYILGPQGLTAWSPHDAITFSPPGGTFAQPVNVTLTAQPGATIYYSTDGSNPTTSSQSLVSGQAVQVSWTGSIRAITTVNSLATPVYSATYTMADADADSIPDWWETSRFGDTATSNTVTDSDADGSADYFEFIAGTNPLDATDRLVTTHALTRLNSWTPIWAHLAVTWPSRSDRLYTVERSSDLQNWQVVQNALPGTGSLMTYSVYDYINSAFYRVRVSPRLQP
jgi:subtilisin family serine protease